MKFKHKLASIALGIVVLASPVFGALFPMLGGGTAEAATYSGFSYFVNSTSEDQSTFNSDSEVDIQCTGSSCPTAGGQTINGAYKYRAGSKYAFDFIPSSSQDNLGGLLGASLCSGSSITVADVNHPEKGTLTDCAGKKSAITIGSTSTFNDFIKAGGAASVGAKVTAKLNLDFGTIDDTKQVPSGVGVQVKCSPDNPSDGVCMTLGSTLAGGPSEGTPLTSNPVVYSVDFSDLKPGHKYRFCWNDTFLKGSDGFLGHDLCTKYFTAKTTAQTISINGKGDPQKLDAVGSTDASGELGCESKAGGLGWILCQLIDGMQSAIGGIYDHIIQPLLITEPITTANKTGNQIYKAWSNFRVYGDVFLVIALIIIVFGESIGGGLIDAYTAKKILPRLLVAAVLINISFYLVAVLVDITNVVGNGLMALITVPFGLTGNFNLDIGATSGTTMTALLAGAVVWAKVSLGGQFMAWLWFSVLLPLLLIFLSIMAVVLIRRVLIVFLVIVSPVAFALYCLPNTEKYFRKWWDTLFETLLVYPIIAVLFALGKVGAYLINHSGGNFLTTGIAQVMSVIALAVPLLLVPFSFKLAGGFAGRAYDLAKGGRDRVKLGERSRERIKAQGARNRVQARSKLNSTLQSKASKGGKFRQATLGRALKGTGGLMGYNIEADASAARAEVSKTLNDQIATGKDDEIRGLTVNKRFAAGQGELVADGEGNMSNGWMRTTDDGKTQYKSLGGAWVDSADVDKGHSRWGKDTYAQQAALSYEMRKAQSEGQLQDLATNYSNVAQGPGGWGQNDQEAGGTWIGAAFERQNEHLEYKDTSWKSGALKTDTETALKDPEGKAIEGTGLRGTGFVNEVYEKKGNYAVSQMGSNTIVQLEDAWNSTQQVLDRNPAGSDAHNKALAQRKKLAGVAETFMSRYGSGPAGGGEDEAQASAMRQQAEQAARTALEATGTAEDSQAGRVAMERARSNASYSANSSGAGHVAERVVGFARLTGVYREVPKTADSANPHQANPNQN